MKKLLSPIAAVGLVLLAASHQAAAAPINVVANGSFETFADGVFTGWTNSGNPGINPTQYAVQQPTDGATPGQFGDVVSPDPFKFSPTAAGTHAAYFVADQADVKLSQNLQLTIGQTYAAGFDLYENPSGAGNVGRFTLSGALTSAGGTTTLGTVPNTALSPGVWTHFATTFVASSANESLTLEYVSGVTPAADVLVDGVYVSAVPEPASLAMFGLGLIGLWGIRRTTFG